MPRYDVFCPEHGLTEVFRHMQGDRALTCAECDGPAEQRFLAAHTHHARIDDAENIGAERRDPRTKGVNIGLPGEMIPLGRDASGRERYDYRPAYATTLGSNKAQREYARAHGLSPADSGRYRSTR